jgi:hypothetical protein
MDALRFCLLYRFHSLILNRELRDRDTGNGNGQHQVAPSSVVPMVQLAAVVFLTWVLTDKLRRAERHLPIILNSRRGSYAGGG